MGVDIPLVWSDAIDSTVILMDQELDLSELDAEVQNMLAQKSEQRRWRTDGGSDPTRQTNGHTDVRPQALRQVASRQ